MTLSKKEILHGVNLRVEDGELICLLGASGCGKSTLLKTVAGIIPQHEGSIFIGGRSVDTLPSHKRRAVIVFQDFRLFPHMTVAENIGFPMRMAGEDRSICEKRASELLDKVQLSGFEQRRIEQMSGGQIQRVALARALAADPVVLLLDEPFSSLDVNLRKDMRQLVMDLQREFRMTTILVTHDHEEALTMSQRIAFMQEGRILQYATPEEIYRNPVNQAVADYFLEGVYLYGEVREGIYFASPFLIRTNQPDGRYRCLVKPSAVKIKKAEEAAFLVVEKIYHGDRYLVKLGHRIEDLVLESYVPDDSPLQVGDGIDLTLYGEKLVFIPE